MERVEEAKISPEEGLRLVRGTVFDSMGCTEPAAIAYAATSAYAHLGGEEIRRVDCTVSVSVFKNAMAVGIPGSDRSGIDFAVALGLLAGDWKRGLELFSRVTDRDIGKASELADGGAIGVQLYEGAEKFYIHTRVETEEGYAEAQIRDRHDALEWIRVNDREVWSADQEEREAAERDAEKIEGRDPETESAGHKGRRSDGELTELLMSYGPEALMELADSLPEEELEELVEGVDINLHAAEYGLRHAPGMGLGRALADLAEEEGCSGALPAVAQWYVAAAVDTRMSGALIPIKGCGGSGNHGITFFLTLGIGYRNHAGEAERSLARTLAFGLLLVRFFKGYTGLLSPTCGVTVSAAPAAAAALLYAYGGSAEEVTAAVKLIEGNLAGILCDGAKQGCALKASTSARSAIETFHLARRGVRIPSGDGIVGESLTGSMSHLRELQEQGLRDADRTMLNILLRKSRA